MSDSEKDDKIRDKLTDFFSELSNNDLRALKKVAEELLRARKLHPIMAT